MERSTPCAIRIAEGVYKTITEFVKEKRSVQGMDVHDGWLYFSQAAEGSVSRARDTNGDGVADDVEVILPPKSLPSGGGHPFEGLLVTDKEIYVTASDPTNMTEAIDSPRKTIYVFDVDGKNKRVFCTGIRNTEKLRFRPGTTEIWGFDHGSDNFGGTYGEQMGKNQPITDLNPPEEFNRYVQDGFYGHPFIMGNGVPRRSVPSARTSSSWPTRRSRRSGWCTRTGPCSGSRSFEAIIFRITRAMRFSARTARGILPSPSARSSSG